MKYIVLGARGMVGAAVMRSLVTSGHTPVAPSIPWGTRDEASRIRAAILGAAASDRQEPWQIIWCAGTGVPSTAPNLLAKQFASFRTALLCLEELPAKTRSRGSLVLASSAGAVYARSSGPPFDETTREAPAGAYGQLKLKEERAIRALSQRSGISTVAARISNVYGPGQNLAKSQGLITQLCLSHLTKRPLTVFVSLDTLRDYIYVDDCADMLVAVGEQLISSADSGFSATKVVSSGRNTSIAALIGTVRRVARSPLPIVLAVSPMSLVQARDIRLNSTVWSHLDRRPQVPLADGIARTLASVRTDFNRFGVVPTQERGAA